MSFLKDWFGRRGGRDGSAKAPPPSPPERADGLTYEALQFGVELDGRPLCRQPFFDASSTDDQRLTTYAETQKPLETDLTKFLRFIADPRFAPLNEAVAFQQWGPETPDGTGGVHRPYFWLDRGTAGTLAEALAESPVRRLILIFTMFEPGALLALATGLSASRAAPALDMLGLWWALCGDDMTDDPGIAREVAQAAAALGVERLSLLTRAFDGRVEAALAEGFAAAPRLRTVRVFRRDDENRWPAFDTRWGVK